MVGITFGMLGILAAMITLSFSFSGRVRFRKYRESGQLLVLIWTYLLAVLSLLCCAAISFLVFSKTYQNIAFDLMVVFFGSSIAQSVMVLLMIVGTSLSFSKQES